MLKPPNVEAKTRRMLAAEECLGGPLETELRRLYYDEHEDLVKIGARAGVAPATIWRWLRRFNLQPRRVPPEIASS